MLYTPLFLRPASLHPLLLRGLILVLILAAFPKCQRQFSQAVHVNEIEILKNRFICTKTWRFAVYCLPWSCASLSWSNKRNVLSTSSLLGRAVKRSDLPLPLGLVRSQNSAVIGQQTINLALCVCGLSPNSTTARKFLCLLSKFFKQQARAVIVSIEIEVDFVCLVDGIAGLLNVPETRYIVSTKLESKRSVQLLLIVGYNMANATEFALEADTLGIILGRQYGVEWCATLGVCIVMVVKEITIAMIVPSSDRVDKSGLIQVANSLCEYLFRVWRATQLSPSLVVNDPLNN